MARLLIVYHSQSGNTEAMAKAFYEGAHSSGATVSLKKAADTSGEDLIGCDAIAIGTPNYFSYMAGLSRTYLTESTTQSTAESKVSLTFSLAVTVVVGGRPWTVSREYATLCNSEKPSMVFWQMGSHQPRYWTSARAWAKSWPSYSQESCYSTCSLPRTAGRAQQKLRLLRQCLSGNRCH